MFQVTLKRVKPIETKIHHRFICIGFIGCIHIAQNWSQRPTSFPIIILVGPIWKAWMLDLHCLRSLNHCVYRCFLIITIAVGEIIHSISSAHTGWFENLQVRLSFFLVCFGNPRHIICHVWGGMNTHRSSWIPGYQGTRAHPHLGLYTLQVRPFEWGWWLCHDYDWKGVTMGTFFSAIQWLGGGKGSMGIHTPYETRSISELPRVSQPHTRSDTPERIASMIISKCHI